MVNQYIDHTIPTTAQLTEEMVNQYIDHTLPITTQLTEEQMMLKEAFEPSGDDSDDDVSLQNIS
jgi:hypothetical protein